MQQRQLRLGDILDDYCPRERRLTNHAVVAMIGADVKQTRCTTCDTEHEYRQGKGRRQRPKTDAAALAAPVVPNAPKKVPHAADPAAEPKEDPAAQPVAMPPAPIEAVNAAAEASEEPGEPATAREETDA